MARSEPEFDKATKQQALERQGYRCASCGTKVVSLGNAGRARHRFGEGAHAHHMRHMKLGGRSTVENCVIICWSCHYNVHEGGRYRTGTVIGTVRDYPFFKTPGGAAGKGG